MLRRRARALSWLAPLLVCGLAYAGDDDRHHRGHYEQHNLLSNRVEIPADNVDPFLVNPWGMAFPPPGAPPFAWWLADNGKGLAWRVAADGKPLFQGGVPVNGDPSFAP